MRKTLNLLLALAASCSLSMATTVTNGSNILLDFNGFYNSSPIIIPGLSGTVNLSGFLFSDVMIAGQGATKVNFNYMVTNDSASPVTSSRISNFAFNTTPNLIATAPNAVTGVYTSVQLNNNQPNGIGTVEVCVTAQNCPGGGSGGVTLGNSGGGSITLYFAGAGRTAFSIDSAFLRYQDVVCRTGSPCSGSASGNLTGVSNIPEPSTYGMLAIGGLMMLIGRRRLA